MQKRAMIVAGAIMLAAGMRSVAAESLYEAPLDTKQANKARLVGGVKATRTPAGVRIGFEVSAYTDVEIAVLDQGGKVVRHLAAGLLGPHAPEPLRSGALKQELLWDGRDDAGRPVSGTAPGAWRVRVRIGASPKLEKVLARTPDALGGIVAMTVGAKGELYVLTSAGGPASGRRICVLDRDGRYARTIMPYSAATPVERTQSVGHLVVDGQRLPIVFNGHAMSLYPLIPNMPRQTMAWNPRGYLVAASATDSAFEFGLPRHLLAFHPRGGAPEGVDFVGPELSVPVGLYRGLGRSLYQRFDNLVCSPDGAFVYYTGGDTRLGSDYYAQPSRHAVFRMRWDGDKRAGMEETFYGTDSRPGHEDCYLNDPRGMAVDRDGNLYICDRNNDRVMIVSGEGEFLGKFTVRDPEQIAVHPRTGELYVISRQRPPDWLRKDHAPMGGAEYKAWRARAKARWEKSQRKGVVRRPTRLAKFSRWTAATPPKELVCLERNFDVMALDAEANPPRLWVTVGGKLERLADKGTALEPDLVDVDRTPGLVRPGHLVAEPERNRVLVFDNGAIRSVAMDTGAVTEFMKGCMDMARAPDGTLYVVHNGKLQHVDSDGNSLPLTPDGVQEGDIGAYAPMGDPGRGLCVAPNGDIYLLRVANQKGVQSRVDVFGPDGTLKKAALVDGLGIGDSGLGVDTHGNVYLGANVKPANAILPQSLRGKVPESNWLCWVQWVDQFRDPPWYYTMRNEYLYHYGAVLKFGPEGGAMYGRSPGKSGPFSAGGGATDAKDVTVFENGPADAPEYRSGYLYHRVKLRGAQWRFPGTGILPTSERYWGDPSCVCHFSRLDADPYGRVYAPDCFQFRVHVLDANGNLISEVGRYGNADDQGPDIHFAWPAYVHAGVDGKLYVSDSLSRQIVIVGFDYGDEAEAAITDAPGRDG